MKQYKASKLTRISVVQHQRLRIIAAYKGRSMMRLINELVDEAWKVFRESRPKKRRDGVEHTKGKVIE